MTECDHEGCGSETVGHIIWDVESEPSKYYCQTHLNQAKEDLPDFIEGVQIV